MTVETGAYISDLNSALPANTDPKSEGDDHIRFIKATIKNTFPNHNGLRCKAGGFTRDAAAADGDFQLLGMGFKPSCILAFAYNAVLISQSLGAGDYNFNQNQMIVFASGSLMNSSSKLVWVSDGTNGVQMELTSMDADGFTVHCTKTGAPTGTINVFFLAFP